MVQAAARGAVDFARGDPRDPRWWRKLVLLIDALDRENLIRICEGYNRNDLATLAMDDITGKLVDALTATIDGRMRTIARALRPWAYRDDPEADPRKALASDLDRLSALWVARWGDPNSPETAARIVATAEALNRDNLALRRRKTWAPTANSR